MKTECVRCHKAIDSVQGYKFSATEYLCMECYDAYKAERAARAKKQHKNPLIDQFGEEKAAPTSQQARPSTAPKPEPPQAGPPQAGPPQATPQQPEAKPAPEPGRAAPPAPERPKPPPVQQAPAAEVCDVCKKPISDFKVPLKGGKKVCWDCNGILREVAKSLILNVQCPHCGKEIQMAQED